MGKSSAALCLLRSHVRAWASRVEKTVLARETDIEIAWASCRREDVWERTVAEILSALSEEETCLQQTDERMLYMHFWLHRGLPGATEVLSNFLRARITDEFFVNLLVRYIGGSRGFLCVWAREALGAHFQARPVGLGRRAIEGGCDMYRKHPPLGSHATPGPALLLYMLEATLDLQTLRVGTPDATWLLDYLQSAIKFWAFRGRENEITSAKEVASQLRLPAKFPIFFSLVRELEAKAAENAGSDD